MDDQKRRIFLSQREVRDAGGPPVIGIRTEVQTISLVVEEPPESTEIPLASETLHVYVEIDPAELKALQDQGQPAIDAFGQRVGPIVARRLGGTVKHWRDEGSRRRHS
jgi:hypothetical protein